MKKKILKILGILLLVVLVVMAGIPFFLESKIGDLIKNNVNSNINGELDFKKTSLSLLRSFPNAEVELESLFLLTKAPFEGDTLFSAEKIELKMGLGELFKGPGEPITVRSLVIDGAKLNIRVDAEENANYDIGKNEDQPSIADGSDAGFTFAMEAYEINDSELHYEDLAGNLHLELLELNHTGSGDLSLDQSELQTNTTALISFALDSTEYLSRNPVSLEALIGIDLTENTYTFLKNEGRVNQLPLVFEGFVKVHEDHQEVQLSFKAPSSDFKNFLAVIPETYSRNIENVKTEGKFEVIGELNGMVDEERIPKFNIGIRSENGSFKYPDLPKSVTNINIDAEIKNNSGLAEETFILVKKASFNIDQDYFSLVSEITDLTGNTKVKASIDGNMDLAKLSQAYPMPQDLDLKGLLEADVTTAFDMASLEKKRYENTKTSGRISVKGFEYKSPELKHPVQLNTLAMDFNPGTVYLKEMDGRTGDTDFRIAGRISNLLGFLFADEKVKGNFDLNSQTFVLNDFMDDSPEVQTQSEEKTKDDPSKTESEAGMKIPSFLDCSVKASANTVVYDNLRLKDVRGDLRIRDQKASLTNMTSSLFDGRLILNGEVSTKNKEPEFAMNLGADGFKIGETFKQLELFRVLAPVASILEGKLNSQITLSGNLENDFTPDLKTLSGNVLAELLATDISPRKAEVLSALSTKLDFLNPEELDLGGLKTALSFENGMVSVKPFTVKYRDIAIEVAGGHTFDQKLNYTATLQVPAKYLGREVNDLIAKIDEEQLEELTIPVKANIGGVYNSPDLSTDLTSGVKDLTAKLVDLQKQKLLNQGKDKAKELLSGILASDTGGSEDTLATDQKRPAVQEVLGGILKKNEAGKDSTLAGKDSVKTSDPVKSAAKEVLGGLFGKKKKDTVN